MLYLAMNETWLPVPGHHRYEVSDLGNIRRARDARRVSTHLSNGYRRAWLRHDDGRTVSHSVARLVLEAFSGPISGRHVARANGRRDDDRLENLVPMASIPYALRYSVTRKMRCRKS